MQYECSVYFGSKVMAKFTFFKVGQKSRSRPDGQHFLYKKNGLATRHT